jgi:hypothetical protein
MVSPITPYSGGFVRNIDGLLVVPQGPPPNIENLDSGQFANDLVTTAYFGEYKQAHIADAYLAKAVNASPGVQPADTGTATDDGAPTYDFTNLTPLEVAKVAAELFRSGKISALEQFRLDETGVSFSRVDADGTTRETTAERTAYFNKPINYIQTLKDEIAFLEQDNQAADPKFGYADLKHILTTLEDLQGKPSSVDITA